MSEIIVQRRPKCNNFPSHSSNDSRHPNNSISWIPKLAFKLLSLLRDDHMSGVKTERSLEELARRFNRSIETISRAFSHLKEIGFADFIKQGQQFCKRWITMCGFIWLESQTSNQTSNQIEPLPYIDLSKREETDILNTYEEENCGKLPEDLSPNEVIESLRIPIRHKERLKEQISKTFIGQNRLKSLTNRVMASIRKNPIQSIVGYFSTAIANEEKQVMELRHLFWKKGIKEGYRSHA